MTTPYYEHGGITIYHGDCREILPTLPKVDLVLTDPPYGVAYRSNWNNHIDRARTVAQDGTVEARDDALSMISAPSVVFGSWKRPPPDGATMRLIWEKTGSSGMGDLSLPWRPNTEDIFLVGCGWKRTQSRESAVIRWKALCGDQRHPTEKPVGLIRHLIERSPPGVVLDPFMGSGTTLRAAKDLHRKAIGIEIEERYCEIAANRLRQEVLPLGGSS